MRKSTLPIARAFKRNLILLVLLPLLAVFTCFFLLTYYNYQSRAMGNIAMVQSSIAEIVDSEVDSTSMMLASLVYANNSGIVDYINACDTDDVIARYNAFQRLESILDYAFQSDSSILSMIFRFASGRSITYGTELEMSASPRGRHRFDSIKEDIVYVNAFRSGDYGRISSSLSGNEMLYSAVIYPSWMIDQSRNIESIELVRTSSVYQEITRYDTAYHLGNNSIGYTALVDSQKRAVLSSNRIPQTLVNDYLNGIEHFGHTYVTTDVGTNELDALLITIALSQDVAGSFLFPFLAIFLLVIVVLFFLFTFSHLLIVNIINPVKRISNGLSQVQEGKLDIYLEEEGYEEIGSTISSFNGMVRHQRALIEDYQSRIRSQETRPERLFSAFVTGTIKDEDLRLAEETLFSSAHMIIALYVGNVPSFDGATMLRSLDANLQFATQCLISRSTMKDLYVIHYRDGRAGGWSEKELIAKILELYEEGPVVAFSRLMLNMAQTWKTMARLEEIYPVLCLYSSGSSVLLDEEEEKMKDVLSSVLRFSHLASALYIADEKVIDQEREALSERLVTKDLEEARKEVLSIVAAFASRLRDASTSIVSFFGYNPSFLSHVSQISDAGSLTIYMNNLLSEIAEKSRMNIDSETLDAVSRAKRYIADNYQYSDLSLSMVSSHVELNERYFSTLFSKETGTSFQSYLASLRIQKARQLIRTTTFKIYEIASMCGYASSENFNKAFRKECGMSPMEYRKRGKNEENTGKIGEEKGEN